MDRFSVIGDQTVANPGDSALAVTQPASALLRAMVYEFTLGHGGTADDTVILWTVARNSTLGTATTTTVNPLDPDGPTSQLVPLDNYTVEPTIANTLWAMPLNQRASWRWVAAPGGEYKIPKTNNNGIIWTPSQSGGTYTGDVSVSAYWEE